MKVDERHSGPRIFGSIIKNPPKHKESYAFYYHWVCREDVLGQTLAVHESVKLVDQTDD